MRVAFDTTHNTNVPVNFGNGTNKPIRVLLEEIDKVHLNDKVSFVLNKLDKDEFLVVSPDKDKSMPIIGRLLTLLETPLRGIYHIKNEKFNETVILSKKNGIIPHFDNFNDTPVRVNTIDVTPYFGINLRQGDRIWGSTLRSILIKEPEIPTDLKKQSFLFRDPYDFNEICQLADDVDSPVRHFAYHRRRR